VCYAFCATPGDEAAFDRALAMAQKRQAALEVVAVADQPAPAMVQLLVSLGIAADEALAAGELRAQLETLVATAQREGVAASCEVLRGDPFAALHDRVVARGHDLLVKAAQPANFVRRVLFGHLDRQLVRRCPCPVWLENPAPWHVPGRVLAAVDPCAHPEEASADPHREALNATILALAADVAEAVGAELHVAHAWPFRLEVMLQSRVGYTPDAIDSVARSVRDRHQAAVHELIEPLRDRITRLHLVKGDAHEELPRLALAESIDLIVMGTVSRSGVPGLLIGNTAETVLDQIECSLLTLRPGQALASPSAPNA
jgi:nucleotide-binding universal stress UspA family protein